VLAQSRPLPNCPPLPPPTHLTTPTQLLSHSRPPRSSNSALPKASKRS
jgi:hypothetical protein